MACRFRASTLPIQSHWSSLCHVYAEKFRVQTVHRAICVSTDMLFLGLFIVGEGGCVKTTENEIHRPCWF
jgi:hypothetical protein